ncbi:neuroglian-like isoform X3 [Littorina saxatilis]|uniref:neuroglian-like isoform X3 n=1 Tax=Littorina saxatilis TaxID=31220 RepID=UPI0038B598F7
MEVRISCAILTIVCSLLVAAREEIKNCKPPAVIKQARRVVYFQQDGTATLECIAKGDETLTYTWQKDDEELDPTTPENEVHMTVESGVGTLILSPAKESDGGTYQCKVQNACGTSLSTTTRLLHAHIDPFPKLDEPLKMKAMMGKPLKLSCNPPDSVPEAQISWILVSGDDDSADVMDYQPGPEEGGMFNSVPLGRRVTMDYQGNLYFVAVEEQDAQEGKHYVCMASNNEVRSMNQGEDKIIEIFGSRVSQEPTVLQWHSDKEVMTLEGRKARFKCIFSGYPTPRVRWRRIDGKMDEGRMKQSSDEHEFVISDVQPEDEGVYECSGENPMVQGVIKETFKLSVESRPRWTKRPKDLIVGVEDNVTFVCDVDAAPSATVQWFINGVPERDAPPAKNRKVHNNALVLTNVTQDDSQVVQCNASNIHGYLWADVYLEVQAMKPTIVSKPTEQKVAQERNVIIPCGVEGKPRPQVMWYKGSQKLEGFRYTILPTGDLQINAVGDQDSGDYSCIAKNRYGQAEAEGQLVVREKTQILSPPIDDRVNYGKPVIFNCGAVTDKLENMWLKYIWSKDNAPVDASDPRVHVKGGELRINATSSKDTGKYKCNATNGLDSDAVEVTLEVVAPPDPPYNLSIVSCGGSDTDLEWKFQDSMSNFSPLEEFVMEYNTTHDPDVWLEAKRIPADKSVYQRYSEHGRQMQFKMSPWSAYSFRVRARNQMGLSEPSKHTHTQCKSAEARPYRNPSGVETVEEKTGYLVIKWEPMPLIEHHSDNFHYNVTWKKAGDDKVNSVEIHDWRQDRHEVKVDGVYEPYVVSVLARNALGDAIVDPLEVPGFSGEARPKVVPENFEIDPDVPVTSTSAGFRWDPVDTSQEAMNGKFQGYKIRYWKKDQFNTTLHEELIIIPASRRRRATPLGYNNKVRGKVSGLPSYSEIESDVVAINNYFSSNSSNIVNFSTPEGVPSRVEYLEALFRGSAHFLLEWGPPIERNGELTGYQLGYQKILGLSIGDVIIHRDDLPPNQQRANIDGLEPNSLYRIFVKAKTAQGAGEPYFIDVRTTDENSELAEPQIEKVHVGEHSVNISFSLSDKEKGKRTGSVYYLEYRKMGDHKWDRDQEAATDHFWLTLDQLEPATTYEVRVVSVPKESGDSGNAEFKPSEETRFDTIGIVPVPSLEEGAKKGSVLSAGWFIGMMVAIAILLLILIIVCIVKRNRGKEYKFPPEKDTVDEAPGHFNEMAKSEKNGVNTSASFERDPEKVPLEDETDSLEDYGDVDPQKFNEDGSFIGQYGDLKTGAEAPNASAMSSIV